MKKNGLTWLPCPACKQPSPPTATRCPVCQIDYTAEQVAARGKKARDGKKGCLVLAAVVAVAIFLVQAFGPQDDASPGEASAVGAALTADDPVVGAQTTPENMDEAFELEREALPTGVPEAPVGGLDCLDVHCAVARAQFDRRDWPRAWRGDYQGQRNAAYCRSSSCGGAVQVNLAEACAWRAIILQAHPTKTDDTDSANIRMDCGKLDQAGIANAIGKAETIYHQIYSRKLDRAAELIN